MNYLVCFDISDDKARRRLVNRLGEYGERVQYSVFEVQLKPTQLKALTDFTNTVLETTDKVLFIPLCGKDLGGRQCDGLGTIYYATSYYFCQ
ncbi:CRISPR-associated endonuclease Cas2 [Pseudoalteromonas sp. JC28]|nr:MULTISPECIES: CRISPR-associated endonuclease Cas2 [unclassified Pseudoalteromonas]NSY36607.1 CRISPR-associated endonuclease Cas2 [Pseudoalteromonas sp. JC28]QUI70527.1 CRISPR-associated endonuclease Cas2 [Pseudoalteromonas sp. M8]